MECSRDHTPFHNKPDTIAQRQTIEPVTTAEVSILRLSTRFINRFIGNTSKAILLQQSRKIQKNQETGKPTNPTHNNYSHGLQRALDSSDMESRRELDPFDSSSFLPFTSNAFSLAASSSSSSCLPLSMSSPSSRHLFSDVSASGEFEFSHVGKSASSQASFLTDVDDDEENSNECSLGVLDPLPPMSELVSLVIEPDRDLIH